MSIQEQHRILIIDDEPDILEFLSYTLRKEGFEVKTAPEGKSGLTLVNKFNPHLVLLDVMMPGIDGIETCEQIRTIPGASSIIICFLTSLSEDYSQIAGFDAGGDDYIIKPVKPRVLVSRIKALLRRSKADQNSYGNIGSSLRAGDLVIDRDRFLLLLEGKEISLPRKEFELMSLFVSRPGKVFTRDEIYSRVWGDDIIVGTRTIDVHIRKLREKVGDDLIHTVKGVGYKLKDKR